MEESNQVPKIIWIYWQQGLEAAPNLIQECISSWITLNPDWEVNILDQNNASKFVELKVPQEKLCKLRVAHQSDLLRLALLENHGGVWVDATLLCVTPLNDWLTDNAKNGFFVYSKPATERVMSNWFIASSKNNYIISTLYEHLAAFWNNNNLSAPGKNRSRLLRLFSKYLNKRVYTTRFWFSSLFTKVLKIYPYFVFHYMFERLSVKDARFKIMWEETPKISAIDPLFAYRLGLLSPLNEEIKEAIESRDVFMHKLTWKYDRKANCENTIVSYLLPEIKQS